MRRFFLQIFAIISKFKIILDLKIAKIHHFLIFQLNFQVTFLGEEAEDAGGVRKEFFLLIMKEVLDPKFGMFTHYEETRTIWFNEFSFDEDMMYMFIGNLCGLAIYNFTIIDLPFPLALYKKILNEKVTYMDLKELSPTVHK